VKIEVGLYELMGARLSVAFVDASHIEKRDDALMVDIWSRLQYLTSWPLMLYSSDGRAYAPFQTHQFAQRLRREHAVQFLEIDLAKPVYEYQDDPPF
jgi:hypothetical protein